MRELQDIEFNIVDVETTGLSPASGDRVIEIAALKIKDFQVIDQMETLIDPQREVAFAAFLVNGISDDMLNGAPTAETVFPEFVRFLSEGYILAHNAKFDLNFINHELQILGLEKVPAERVLDSLKMSRALLPGLRSYALKNVAGCLGVNEEQRHRAMADVQMTYKVFRELLRGVEKQGVAVSDVFLKMFSLKKPDSNFLDEKLQAITRAINAQNLLRMAYIGVKSGITLRDVTPLQVLGQGRGRKLKGFCHLRNEERLFVLEKIVFLEEVST